jgi:hypothetical protein
MIVGLSLALPKIKWYDLVGHQFWQKLTSKPMVFAPVPEK